MFRLVLFRTQNRQVLLVIRCWLRSFSRGSADKHQQILLFPKTEIKDLKVTSQYEIIQSLDSLRLKTVRGGRWRRPELKSAFISECYNEAGAALYTQSHRSQRIQKEMTLAAIELLCVSPSHRSSRFILDVGCGSGISSQVLVEAGFHCIGVDASQSMLELFPQQLRRANGRQGFSGTVMCDISKPFPLRAGSADGAVSISVLQWLFVLRNPARACRAFLKSLQRTLRPGARAVVQFYPRCRSDVEMVWRESVDMFPNGALICCCPSADRGRKLFLLLINSQEPH